nr:MAG TPA: hypothetical protein [Bacteriophage sp.]
MVSNDPVKSTTCDKLTFPAFAGVILIKIFFRLRHGVCGFKRKRNFA